MKQSLLPRGLFIALLVLFVRASSAISTRKLLNSAGALVDELEGLRQRLVESTGFSQPQWARKLQQAYYPTVSYGDYGYGYYGYYGAYSSGGGTPYTWMGRRLMGDAASGEGSHARALKMSYPYPYGYGGYYGYYYGGYGAYPPANWYQMMTGRRRMLGNVERLAELLTDDQDGFVKPGDRTLLEAGVEDPRRALKAMPYDYPTNAYGYSYGYGYYYGGYAPNPYSW